MDHCSGPLTSGGSARDGGPEDPLLGGEVDFDGGVAARVVDLPGKNLGDRHLESWVRVSVSEETE